MRKFECFQRDRTLETIRFLSGVKRCEAAVYCSAQNLRKKLRLEVLDQYTIEN